MAEVTKLTRSVGLSIAKNFEHNNDAEVLICSRYRHRALEAAKEITGKVVGAELSVTSMSKAKQPLEEIIDDRQHITIVVKKTCHYFGCNTWYKIDDELESIREVALNGSTRNPRNHFDTLLCCNNFSGG
jgi:NADP-dependent 3-hydroxy acid dehydrogenase YdfG